MSDAVHVGGGGGPEFQQAKLRMAQIFLCHFCHLGCGGAVENLTIATALMDLVEPLGPMRGCPSVSLFSLQIAVPFAFRRCMAVHTRPAGTSGGPGTRGACSFSFPSSVPRGEEGMGPDTIPQMGSDRVHMAHPRSHSPAPVCQALRL